eukprot:IDg2523t1
MLSEFQAKCVKVALGPATQYEQFICKWRQEYAWVYPRDNKSNSDRAHDDYLELVGVYDELHRDRAAKSLNSYAPPYLVKSEHGISVLSRLLVMFCIHSLITAQRES